MVIPVILSGGSGTRLWPLSRRGLPKQFHSIRGNHTLIQDTARRFDTLTAATDPIVVCGPIHVHDVATQMAAIEVNASLIVEPSAKNTAPAIGAACLEAQARDPKAVVVIVPSDHVFEDPASFEAAIEGAVETAKSGYLTTLGVAPSYPATGYGYISPGAEITKGAHRIASFVEKPDKTTAAGYLDLGYFWNAGIFIFRADVFLDELTIHQPAMSERVHEAYRLAERKDATIMLADGPWNEIVGTSIDYGVMERTDRGAVIPFTGAWSDVGSWEAVYDLAAKDSAGNATVGTVVAHSTTGSYIRSESKPIVTVGVNDLVIVETPDAILISTRESSEQVKEAIASLPDDVK